MRWVRKGSSVGCEIQFFFSNSTTATTTTKNYGGTFPVSFYFRRACRLHYNKFSITNYVNTRSKIFLFSIVKSSVNKGTLFFFITFIKLVFCFPVSDSEMFLTFQPQVVFVNFHYSPVSTLVKISLISKFTSLSFSPLRPCHVRENSNFKVFI